MHAALFVNYVKAISDIRGSRVAIIHVLGLSAIEPANRYGPYADRLQHLLDGLDGSYLHCEKRLSDAGPFDLIWFEDAKREAIIPALERATTVIDGFESSLGMELLATVDWLLFEGTVERTVAALRSALKDWPGGGEDSGDPQAQVVRRPAVGSCSSTTSPEASKELQSRDPADTARTAMAAGAGRRFIRDS